MSPAAPLLQHLLSPLDPWLEDPATEDIAINRPGEAWIRQRGAWLRHDVALDGEALEEIAILAGSLRQQEVSALSPLCATELPRWRAVADLPAAGGAARNGLADDPQAREQGGATVKARRPLSRQGLESLAQSARQPRHDGIAGTLRCRRPRRLSRAPRCARA